MARKEPIWALRNKEFKKIPPEQKKWFKEITPKNTDPRSEKLEKELNAVGYFKWLTYPDDKYKNKDVDPFKLNRKGQRKYEIFCGGFLYFYDEEHPDNLKQVEQRDVEHKVFLAWSKAGDVVRIFISPKPGNPDPPTTPGPPPPESSN